MSVENQSSPQHLPARPEGFLAAYVWFILKNLIGWLLILMAFIVGPAVPGPGGIPLFLIGFALVSFPGKRRLTTRVLRGKRVRPRWRRFLLTCALTALILPAIGLLAIAKHYQQWIGERVPGQGGVVAVYMAGVLLVWLLMRISPSLLNVLLRGMPRARRFIRPWLRHRGIRLLPPRRRQRPLEERREQPEALMDEILEIHERHHDRAKAAWKWLKPWLRRLAGVLLMAVIFYFMFRPIILHWTDVRPRINQTSTLRFVLAAGMFALGSCVVRVTSWRIILRGLGHRLPAVVATRIWSASELARFLPGVIWQVAGRVYLSRPYGISGAVCSVSQVLELTILLLANILVGAACLFQFGTAFPPQARRAIFLIPILLVILHPRIFYPAMNWLLGRLHKPTIQRRLPGRVLVGLVLFAIVGLLWQTAAIWILTAPLLNLPASEWWLPGGIYCLAWSAGFTFGSVTPGGLGVREGAFVAMMSLVLPGSFHARFPDHDATLLFLSFLAILLRLWATAGELSLAAIAHLVDFHGALGHADAPGRQPLPQTQVVEGK